VADGILNLLKPPGLTSHDAVQEVRRIFGERHAGHTGTLDPGAAGVLVVCLGEATKAVAYLEDHEKEYWAEAVLGSATFTQDAEGEVTEEAEVGWTTDSERIAAAAERLTGELDQTVPLVSAVHQDGQRLYALARRGVAVDRPVRRVSVSRLAVEELVPNAQGALGAGARLRVRVTCSRGTYVRALLDELGRMLGGFAHLGFLLRLRSGPFPLAEAVTLEEAAAAETPAAYLRPAEATLDFPELVLRDEDVRRFRNGVILRTVAGPVGLRRVFGYPAGEGSGRFVGIGEVDATGELRPRRLFGVREGQGGR
jgi:tRNA pseudouridine55 synthase